MAEALARRGETSETSVITTEATALAKTDLNFLGMLSAPEEFVLPFPPFYLALFQLLSTSTKKLERYAIGIPRGFAKTTFIKLLCLWYILFSQKQFILIVGASEDLAVNTLSDICDLLNSSNIISLFGNWENNCEVNTQALKVFSFRGRNIILRAIGAGTAVRGINRKNKRPDVIIMDDVQKREIADSKELSDQLLRWILGTLMLARSNFGCTYLYVGNMYPHNAILEQLKNNSQWTSFIVGGILADGTSLWEELRPAEDLISEYRSASEMGHPEIFISEILNSTDILAPSGLDLSKIPFLPPYFENYSEVAEGSFIIIDPSSGKKDGDDCTINHFSVCDGKVIFDHLRAGLFTPLETIKTAIAIGLERNTRLIAVESVAYQSTLLFWFEQYCTEQGITGFEFVELSPKGAAKNARIKLGVIKLLAGDIYLTPDTRSLVLSQLSDWSPLKTNNRDDIIDPIGYVDEIMQSYSHILVKNTFALEDYSGTAAHSSTNPAF